MLNWRGDNLVKGFDVFFVVHKTNFIKQRLLYLSNLPQSIPTQNLTHVKISIYQLYRKLFLRMPLLIFLWSYLL